MEKFNPDLVVADFDGTITQKVIWEKVIPSLISILRNEGLLDEDYSNRAKALYNKYGVIEKDSNYSEEEKFQAMLNWWKEHFELLKEKGLTKDYIDKAVYHPDVQVRKWFDKFLEILKEKNIPLIVFSSSWLGDEAIKDVFKKFWLSLDNVVVISNQLKFDENWKFVGVDEDKILHSMNKKLKDHLDRPEVANLIKDKKNVLLLGDSLHDPDMLDWMDFEKVYKVGFFLPEKLQKPEDREIWSRKYDLLLEADSDFSKIIKLIS